MMAATPCAFLPCPGFRESCRSLNWRTHKKQLARKSGTIKVRAKFELNPPPYPMNTLEPHMSRTTFEYHWGKHHRAYMKLQHAYHLDFRLVSWEAVSSGLEAAKA